MRCAFAFACVCVCLYVFLCVRKSFCVLAANWLALQMCAALWAYSNKLECLDLIQLTSLAHTQSSRRGSIPMSKEDLQLAQLRKSKDADESNDFLCGTYENE